MDELPQDVKNEMVQLVYNRWAAEFDLLKKVNQETNDGSKDWAAFHAKRLKYHTAAEGKWKAILDQVKPFARFG